jgi:uncharacterized iron-regulated membrane protein
MFWKTILHRPQSTRLRRSLFQIHLWTGLGAGIYIMIVCTSGAALMFRGEIQRARHPDFFPREASEATEAPMENVVANIQAAFPDHDVVGVGAPTADQHTFTGYISKDGRFRAVFAEAASGAVIGALETGSFLLSLQNLHFYLMSGTRGLMINGIGGLLLFVMAVTGVTIWWPGIALWRRHIRIDPGSGRKRLIWDLHSVTGIWTVAFIAMWALTGAYFAFPRQVRQVVSLLSATTAGVAPESAPGGIEPGPAPTLTGMIARAEADVPGSRLVRVSLPASNSQSTQVVVTRTTRASVENDDYVYVFFDQFTGEIIGRYDLAERSLGDRILPWFGRLHVGNFGGLGLKIVWFVVGLVPAFLFATGVLVWWSRVVIPRTREMTTL